MIDAESYEQDGRGTLQVGGLCPLADSNRCSCTLCLDPEDGQWIKEFPKVITDAEDDVTGVPYTPQASEENYLLLPARVLGWAFKTSTFAQFLVDHVHMNQDKCPEQEFDKQLIFPKTRESNKADIKNLIMAHKSNENKTSNRGKPILSDPVAGKGAGLVILLHGIEKTLL